MDATFDLATVADLDLLVTFVHDYHTFDHLAFDEAVVRRVLTTLLTDDTLGRAWLIRHGGDPVGYVVVVFGYSVEFHGRDAFIDELYLQATHRGKGIGTQAIRFVEAECRRLGVQALHLEVERANAAAQALYHRVGFEDHDRYLLTKWLGS